MFDDKRTTARKLLLGSLRGWVRGLEVAELGRDEAVALVDWFAEVERLAGAGKALAAAAATSGEAWRAEGHRSGADWLARRTGTTVGDARVVLDAAGSIEPGSATDAAFRGGELSMRQAEAVASAASVDPGVEAELLDAARHESVAKLRHRAARARAAADPDPAARHDRIRRSRFWRRWTDADGARCGTYRLTPEDGAAVEAHAQPFIDAAIDAARHRGDHEPSEAYAADGLVAMAAAASRGGERLAERDGGGARDGDGDGADAGEPGAGASTGGCDGAATGAGSGDGAGGGAAAAATAAEGAARGSAAGEGAGTGDAEGEAEGAGAGGGRPARGGRGRRRLRDRRELIALVDLAALRRGSLERGETCEIAGVGPVPVQVARDVFGDALLRIVIRDGVDVRTVVHTGRTATAVQETAVLVRQGGWCARPTCDLPISEIDHTQGFRITKQTTLDDLAGLCGADHDHKTRHGHTYRRRPDGAIDWIRPDGTIEPGRPPP